MPGPDSSPLLLIISAPSGGGKTTLCEQVLASDPHTVRAITCTTRSPRDGERDGVDYYFLDRTAFEAHVRAGEFMEHALVHGNSYGTLRTEVLEKLRQGKNVLLSIDVQGAETIRNKAGADPELRRSLVTVFITPPSLAMLEERLKRRGQDSAGVIRKRLSVAREEIAQWKHYDYLIISTSIAEDLRRMQAILLAEKMRHGRAQLPICD